MSNANQVLDRKSLSIIRLYLSPPNAFNISKDKTMKDLMVTLSWMYEKLSTLNKAFLMKRLFHMKMVKRGTIIEQLNEFNTATSQLKSMSMNFDEEVRTLLILFSLPKSWDGLVMTLSNSLGSRSLKFYDIVSIILSEEVHRKSPSESSESVLVTPRTCHT